MLGFIPVAFRILILAAIPILEQKAAIPVGIIAGLPVWEVYILTLIGAIIPSPIIIWFIEHIFEFLRRYPVMDKLITKFETKTRGKSDNIQKYKLLGLFLFVAIPLPGTGVWTGSLAAVLLGLGKKSAVVAVFMGAVVCGLLILGFTSGVGLLMQ
ncbi:MAG TPA: small multi-drug export protein [Epulopiscium sp.]|nr:small multi-drug export protein [Candidatus Epulonipiscium sp.]